MRVTHAVQTIHGVFIARLRCWKTKTTFIYYCTVRNVVSANTRSVLFSILLRDRIDEYRVLPFVLISDQGDYISSLVVFMTAFLELTREKQGKKKQQR